MNLYEAITTSNGAAAADAAAATTTTTTTSTTIQYNIMRMRMRMFKALYVTSEKEALDDDG